MEKKSEVKEGAPEWMVTYGDLVTLLMCFFVLLFAFSEIDAQKFPLVMQSFRGSAGVLDQGKSLNQSDIIFDASPEKDTTPDLSKSTIVLDQLKSVKAELEQALSESTFKDDVIVELEDNMLIIRLQNQVLFNSGKAVIKPESLKVLKEIGRVIENKLDQCFMIEIEGHTDNVPSSTQAFPDNITLSFARAYSVRNYLVDQSYAYEKRLKVSALGEFEPIDTNMTAQGRANNRRVEIIIYKMKSHSVKE